MSSRKYRWLFALLGISFGLTIFFLSIPRTVRVESSATGGWMAMPYPWTLPWAKNDSSRLRIWIRPSLLFDSRMLVRSSRCIDHMAGDPEVFRLPTGTGDCPGGASIRSVVVRRGFHARSLEIGLAPGSWGTGELETSTLDSGQSWLLAVLLPLALGLLGWAAGIPRAILAFLVAGTALRAVLSASGPPFFGDDLGFHLEYVRLIVQTHRIPKPSLCWECYQPPFFYLTAALVQRVGDQWTQFQAAVSLRLYSLALSCAFLLCGLSALWPWLRDSRHRLLGLGLFTFWPGIVVHAAGLNNDAFVNLFGLLSLGLVCRWWVDRKSGEIIWAVLCALLAMLSKTNGILYLFIACLSLGWAVYREHEPSFRRRWIQSGAVALTVATPLGICVAAGSILRSRMAETRHDALVGNFTRLELSKPLLEASNSLRNFAFPDIASYFTTPFIFPETPALYPHNYWNFLLKSSLSGESRLGTDPLSELAALVLCICLLGIALLCLLGIRQAWKRCPPLLFAPLILVPASMAFRYRYPFPCSADFRYIAPLVFVIAILTAYGLDSIKHSVFHSAGRAVVRIFIGIACLLLGSRWI
jgi:hypothetical protein